MRKENKRELFVLWAISGHLTVLTHAHWERYYLTTGYRLFSQHPVEDRRTIWALG